MEPQIQTKSFRDPPKHPFYYGKTMGYGKSLFPQKTKLFFVRFLEGCGVPRNPVFYKVCFKILGIKKSARLGPMLAASWTLPSPKPCILQCF